MSDDEMDMSGMDEFDRLIMAQPDIDYDMDLPSTRSSVNEWDRRTLAYRDRDRDPDVEMVMNTEGRRTSTSTSRTPRLVRGPPVPQAPAIEPPLDLGEPIDSIDEEDEVHSQTTIQPHPLEYHQAPEIFETREKLAFAFAIEHVLMYQGNLIPGAAAALKILRDNGIPFGIYTNDDGFRDADQMEGFHYQIARAGITIERETIVDYSCPFKTVSHNLGFAGKHVLIVSGYGEVRIRALAQRAGFRGDRIWTPPSLGPNLDVPIAAIMVWSQPYDWDSDLKVICRVLSKNRQHIKVFVCTDDFNRHTNFVYPATDYWTFYHMVTCREEWSNEDKKWLDKILMAPWANNFRNDLFLTFEELFAKMLNEKNANTAGINKMYLITENFQRDRKALERHEDQTVSPAPAWEIIPIANIGREPNWWVSSEAHLDHVFDADGTKKFKHVIEYVPQRKYMDVYSAVRSLLASHSSAP